MHWGHAISPDLATWTTLPIALSPSTPYDKAGVFTGSLAFLSPSSSTPTILYTGVTPEAPLTSAECVAAAFPSNISDPFLLDWEKDPSNPLVPPLPLPSILGNATAFRDPTELLFFPHHTPFFAMGAGSDAGLGYALRYSLPHFPGLDSMAYSGVILSASSTPIDGAIWECPDPYLLDGVAVLKVSSRAGGYGDHYYIGKSLTPSTPFAPFSHGIIDYGYVYASKSFTDPRSGNRVLMGWSMEGDAVTAQVKRNWAGLHIVPRVLSLAVVHEHQAPVLVATPVPALQDLRTGAPYILSSPLPLPTSGVTLIPNLEGTTLDLTATFSLPSSSSFLLLENGGRVTSFGLVVRSSPDGQEETRISVFPPSPPHGMTNVSFPNPSPIDVYPDLLTPSQCASACAAIPYCAAWSIIASNSSCVVYGNSGVPASTQDDVISGWSSIIAVDRSSTSLALTQDTTPNSGRLYTPLSSPQNTLDLRVLLDNSVMEVFANGGTSRITSRIYPTLPSSTLIGVFGSFPNAPDANTITLQSLESHPMGSCHV